MKFLKTIFLFLLLVSITGNVEAQTVVKRPNMVETDVLIDHLNNTLAEKIPAHIQRRYGALNLEEGRISYPESTIALVALAVGGMLYSAAGATMASAVGVFSPVVAGFIAVKTEGFFKFYSQRWEYHFELDNMPGSCLVYFAYNHAQQSVEYEIDACKISGVSRNEIIYARFPQEEEGRVRIGEDGADVFDRIQGQTQVVATGSIPLDLEN